jgi:hypothetical protein
LTHELKSWPQFFQPEIDGMKTFEIRINDREGGFHVGDLLYLREWSPETKEYSGREAYFRVLYVLGADQHCAVSPVAINPGYVVMGIKPAY